MIKETYESKTKEALRQLRASLVHSQVSLVAAYLDACIEELKDDMESSSEPIVAQAGIKCVRNILRSLTPT